MKLYQLIYVSKTINPMSQNELKGILRAAKQNNSDRSITGLLVYDSGHFFQVLEGGYNEVEALFSKIQQDKRHARVNRIFSGHIKERFFNGWNMGFYHLEEMSDLDFFKLRKCMKSLHAITSVDEQKTLAKYALKLFVDLKENVVEVG